MLRNFAIASPHRLSCSSTASSESPQKNSQLNKHVSTFSRFEWDDVADIVDVVLTDEAPVLTQEILDAVLSRLHLVNFDRQSICDILLDPTNGFGTWNLDVILLSTFLNQSVLTFLCLIIFSVLDFDDVCMEKLASFVDAIERQYNRQIVYHNADHAADVLHSLYCILTHTDLRTKMNEPMQIAALLAAIVHDVRHVGLTNKFLKDTHDVLAASYPVCCPLEAMHAEVGLQTLSQFNVLATFPPRVQTHCVQVIQRAIFTTSLCEQKEMLADLAAAEENTPEYWMLVVQCAVHVADLGQTSKPALVHRKWVKRLHEEFFLQGDLERERGWVPSLDCDRHKGISPSGQWKFMDMFVIPAFEALKNIPGMGAIDVPLRQVHANIEYWKVL